MNNDRIGGLEQTLQQLVAGQAITNTHLDKIDGRLDALDDKVQLLSDAQAISQELMTKGFHDLRKEFKDRLVPLETAVRGLSGARTSRNGRPAAGRPRKRTPRR